MFRRKNNRKVVDVRDVVEEMIVDLLEYFNMSHKGKSISEKNLSDFGTNILLEKIRSRHEVLGKVIGD